MDDVEMKRVLQKVLQALSVEDPTLFILAKSTRIVKREKMSFIAATDGWSVFLSSSYFELSPRQQVKILAHELLHITFLHITRAKKWLKRNTNIPPLFTNIVADAIVNERLTPPFKPEEGEVRLSELVSEEEYERLRSSSYEELLDYLKDKLNLPPVPLDLLFAEGEGDGSEQSEEGGAGQGSSRQDNDSRGGAEGAASSPSEEVVLNEGEGEKPRSPEELERKIGEKVLRAAMTAKSAGRIPGWLERAIEDLLRPKIDWRKVLRSHMQRGLGRSVRRTWSRPSRKNPTLPGKESLSASTIIVLADVSGSIDERTLCQFLGEVYSLAHEVAKVVVVPWDATVYDPIILRRSSDVRKLKVQGGGGTVISPALKYIEQYSSNLIVILSDWDISDLNEPFVQRFLEQRRNRIIAVTTSSPPPQFLTTIKLEI